ncbi:hypothetical protein NDU88_005865 [Pleurodeles waltl]|uniref:Uncharacterized protein n=1 Tax=Pleurodeles waltl TaxID=8319 RepID=A0AAV7QID8_PLEWA|nr:hypothetical protein NDU88_005865 [Pleurodeles waltl]
MPVSHTALQIVTFLWVVVLACYSTSQETENRRAVTEHQFMHDKGKAIQGLKRLIWLHSAMGGVHTASGRDLSGASRWDVNMVKDIPSLDSNGGANPEQTEYLMTHPMARQAQEELRQRLESNKSPLQYEYPQSRWSLQEFSDKLQGKENNRKNPIISQAL